MNKLLLSALVLSTTILAACGGGSGSNTTSGIEIQRGVAINGFVERDQGIVYNITGLGVTQIELTSTSGDADLFVFNVASINPDPLSTDNQDDIICVSENSTPIDRCIIPSGSGRTIAVGGFTDASFQLVVN